MIIFLNGSINAGKTTVAKLLVKEIPRTALLEIDALAEMIEWMPLNQAVPINLKNAVSLMENFVEEGINVIVPYPISQKNYDYMTTALKKLDVKMYVFTLAPKLETALVDRGTRKLNDWERDRIKHHYDIGIHSPSFGEIIDNSEQTPEETAVYIVTKVSDSK